jgi:hypothetical protein
MKHMTNSRHATYNILTGEIITSSTGNALKRRVAIIEKWNREHGYGKGKWVFSHGFGAIEKVCKKAVSLL